MAPLIVAALPFAKLALGFALKTMPLERMAAWGASLLLSKMEEKKGPEHAQITREALAETGDRLIELGYALKSGARQTTPQPVVSGGITLDLTSVQRGAVQAWAEGKPTPDTYKALVRKARKAVGK